MSQPNSLARVWTMIHGPVAFGPRGISYNSITRPPLAGIQREGVDDMTGNAQGREAFQKSLLECVQDINKLLPGLSHRYDMTVIISALAEHVGAALQVLIRKNICDARQAGLIIKQIEGSAFLRGTAKPKTPGSPPGADDTAPDARRTGENSTRH
jgi:hypothetical protein